MNLTRIEQYPNDDFTIVGNHAKMSQRKVAEITKVSQPTVANWIDKLTDSNTAQTLRQQGFSVSDLIDYLKYIVIESKRTNQKTKRHCLDILIKLIDKNTTQELFTELLNSYHSQYFNRPKENLIDSHINDGRFIYLIHNKTTGNLKIGYSVNPCRRFIELQQATDCELKLLAFFEGTQIDEQVLLTKYSQYNIRGEWFKPCPEIYLDFGLTDVFLEKSI
jgi:predicted transcriptional regulator